MKIIAIILNLILLSLVVWLLVEEGMPTTGIELFSVLFVFACPIVNIIALLRANDKGWMCLYLKRKALEEKKKIEALTSNTETEQDKDN